MGGGGRLHGGGCGSRGRGAEGRAGGSRGGFRGGGRGTREELRGALSARGLVEVHTTLEDDGDRVEGELGMSVRGGGGRGEVESEGDGERCVRADGGGWEGNTVLAWREEWKRGRGGWLARVHLHLQTALLVLVLFPFLILWYAGGEIRRVDG